ncbi:MAG: endonuclease/exonuclease/phosphatase family protein [Pirellulaceae bacterium]|nr:endonuclease/exonuclease/phosphatase family protein [Pirellulaceae bacterium]
MPFYYSLQDFSEADQPRVAGRLLALRNLLEFGVGSAGEDDYIAPIPQRTINETLLLATWNIREFDAASYGARVPEAMLYIAEIISRFDIVAIQEVREDLRPLEKLRNILGRYWRFVVSDVTLGDPGNSERLAIMFDSRKVRFTWINLGSNSLPVHTSGTNGHSPDMTV